MNSSAEPTILILEILGSDTKQVMSSSTHRAKSASVSSKIGTRSISRKDAPDIPGPVPLIVTPALATSGDQQGMSGGPISNRIEATWPQQVLPVLTHARSGSHLPTSEYTNNRLSTGPAVLMSSMASMPSLKQSQKKPGGFKATIRRMFGSKRQRPPVDAIRREYHKSDPGILMNTENPQTPHSSPSSSSRPRTSMHGKALGSHIVNSSSATRDFEPPTLEHPSIAFKRRNTLPSLAFSEHESQSFSRRLGDMMDDKFNTADLPRTMLNQEKRRSRSADALAQKYLIDAQQEDNRQDRESEIAFWRNSTLLSPLPQSFANTAINASFMHQEDGIKEVPSLESIIQPIQDFDFGLDHPAQEPAGLEERVNTLEVKMFDFEYALAKLQGIELPKPPLPTKRMKRRNVQRIFSKPSIQSLSTTSDHDIPPITPGDSPIMSTSMKDDYNPDRGSKATTIRPYVRNDSPMRSSLHLSPDQFDSLMSMLQDEKEARQMMEMQILDLQKELQLLQSPVYATINYPASSTEGGMDAATQRKLHRSPPFRLNKPPMRETSRFSMAESDVDSLNEVLEEQFQTPRERQNSFGASKDSPLINMTI